MQTNKIKRFATEARNRLKAGIAAKITTLGFDSKGHVADDLRPELMQGGSVWKGEIRPEGFYHQWTALHDRIQQKGLREVYEEAAYRWFNRLVAIRILQKNGLSEPVLAYVDEARTPRIVDEARMGRMPQMTEEQRKHLLDLLDDDRRTTEQFALLITAFCHQQPIIHQCFGSMGDYTELLLPDDILAEGGFVDMLNQTDYITDDDFRSPELIGWLYQFYISERKDEVFAKKGKFEADEIPAATQIFTPNWIVKYMVENTIGRIYLDKYPFAKDDLAPKWKYLVGGDASERHYEFRELTDLKVADLACGSGHILGEMFDLLYDLYLYEGYSRSEAIENILTRNLSGIDLDLRAKQLAQFALLLKACQKDAAFADAHCMPRVLSMPVADEYTWREVSGHFDCAYGLTTTESVRKEMDVAIALLRDADSLGSIMRFDLSDESRTYIAEALQAYDRQPMHDAAFATFIECLRLISALTEHYSALVMNPPYMGSGNMNSTLAKYVKAHYEMGKADLFSVFMLLAEDRLQPSGKYGMINMQSWMFLSSFEKLRTHVLEQSHIDSMLHLGPHTFDELSGEVVQNTAFVISNHAPSAKGGTYYRLVEAPNCGAKEMLFSQTLANPAFKYRFKDYTKEATELPYDPDGQQIYYPNVPQKDFEKIPGCPIGYWVSEKILATFTRNLPLSAVANPCVGLQTADNGRFLRQWFEVSQSRIGFGFADAASAARSGKKWFPYNKGGSARKWYGNQELVVNWENDGKEIKNFKGAVVRNPSYYFKPSIAWSLTSSVGNAFRYFPQGFIFDVNGMSLFTDNIGMLSYLNTKMCKTFLSIINPTLACQIGNVAALPYCHIDGDRETSLAKSNISLSRADWDAHETSWDFERNPLLEEQLEMYVDELSDVMPGLTVDDIGAHYVPDLQQPLEVLMDNYKAKWEDRFMQLHANEEELNRQFISIYGLEDELSPDVPLQEVTILQQGEITIEE